MSVDIAKRPMGGTVILFESHRAKGSIIEQVSHVTRKRTRSSCPNLNNLKHAALPSIHKTSNKMLPELTTLSPIRGIVTS